MSKKKIESNFLNMFLVLSIVCLVSSSLLGGIYSLTKDRIKKSLENKTMMAIKKVILPGYDNNPKKEKFKIIAKDNEKLECYPAMDGGKLTSVALKSSSRGFSGDIVLMVGLFPDGSINKISVVNQSETPGLGTKITSNNFLFQFKGKNPRDFILKVKNDGGDVDAITAATISSRSFCLAVQDAYDAFIKYRWDNRDE